MDSDIKKPRMAEIPMINIWVAENYKFGQEGYEAEFKSLKKIFRCKDHRVTGHSKIPAPDNIQKNFLDYLKAGKKPENYEKILMDAKEYSELYNEHDLSIMLTELAFEVFIKESIIYYCEAKSIQHLEIKKRRSTPERLHYRDAVDKYNISESIKVLSELIGENLKSLSEYGDWYRDSYTRRNEIIHNGNLGFNQNESWEALVAASIYMETINTKMNLALQA